MNDEWQTIITLVTFIFIAIASFLAFYFNNKARKARNNALKELAGTLGFEFLADEIRLPGFNILEIEEGRLDDRALFTQFFQFFEKGTSRTIEGLITGTHNGVIFHLADYRYTVRSGKHQVTHKRMLAVAQVGYVFPKMTLDQEGFGASVEKFLGVSELQVESEEFNKAYYIATNDEKQTHQILHPLAIEYLLKQPMVRWEFSGPYLLIQESRQEPEKFIELMERISGFVMTVPPYFQEDNALQGRSSRA